VRNERLETLKNVYQSMGYNIDTQEQWSTLTCSAEIFKPNTPLFVHAYVQKIFGSIPPYRRLPRHSAARQAHQEAKET
jgi:hypothetical protein